MAGSVITEALGLMNDSGTGFLSDETVTGVPGVDGQE